MTNPTLERAARAAAETDSRGGGANLYDTCPELYLRIARAVLMAVREPDEATVEALFQARDGFVDKQDIAPLHRLVIDFALGENNETDDLTKSAVVSKERA